jgi:hypothetical protein
MAVIQLKSYRIAKQYSKDAEVFMRILSLTIEGLQHYSRYKPIGEIVASLKSNKQTLDAHLQSAQKILAKKEVKDVK